MVIIKSPEEIRCVRKSCKLAASALNKILENIKEGITTLELDRIAEDYIIKHGARPAFKGYGIKKNKFQHSICVSINEEVVHGIPGKRRLREGDIVSIDIGTNLEGYYGDTATTVPVGRIDPKIQKLLEVTKKSLFKGIEKAIVGNRLGDISFAIQQTVEKSNFSVVREYVGHGVGCYLHEEPQIPNYGVPHTGLKLEEGMVLALEPMVNMGGYKTRLCNNGWTVVTEDGSWSAHFEHSIAITEDGNEILTNL
jgi:methionyl aminopeptidase